MKLTKNQEEFIGTEFTTPKGGVLTVVGVRMSNSSRIKFTLKCSVCSLDKGLWPEGSIQSVKSSLLEDKTPCGCGGAVRWTEDQYKILVTRRCERYGYIFKGWIGNYKGRNTKLDLHNPSTNNSWKSNTIKEFLKGRIDPLVSKRKIWTQEEREIQIYEKLQEEGGNFIRWSSNYKNSKSKFKWLCSKGHLCETNVSKFCNSGQRCMVCRMEKQKERKNYYGYFPERVAEIDNLYVIRFKKDKVIKVGRAFDLHQRMHTQSHSLLKISNHREDEVQVLKVFTGLHQDVFEAEQWLHENLTGRGFHADWIEWTTECFTEDSEQAIYRLLDKIGLGEGGV